MTIRLLLVSHAATAATRRAAFPTDLPISPTSSAAISGRVALALSGPELRCVQTGQLFGLSPTTDPALRDCDYGTWAGHTLDEINVTSVEQWLADSDAAPHGGESLAALLDRVGSWLDHTSFPTGRTVAFTHPAVIRAAIVHALHAPPMSFWRIDIAPLSLTTLSGGPRRWTLRELAPAEELAGGGTRQQEHGSSDR